VHHVATCAVYLALLARWCNWRLTPTSSTREPAGRLRRLGSDQQPWGHGRGVALRCLRATMPSTTASWAWTIAYKLIVMWELGLHDCRLAAHSLCWDHKQKHYKLATKSFLLDQSDDGIKLHAYG